MDLEQSAFEALRFAAAQSLKLYKQPLVITYSGGKDSDVLLRLAELIDEQPTVDAVLVVHCKECDKRGTIFCPMVHETLGSGLVDYASDDGYCNWARRKE